MTWVVRRTPVFESWLAKLRDLKARAIIVQRVTRLAAGQIGDFRSIGEGVNELRVDHGPGYRIYFVRRGEAVIVLLCGGDKGSQARDIARAKNLAKET